MNIKLITFIPLAFCFTHVSAENINERELGRLFTSPAERQKIDAQKSGDVTQTTSRRITPSSVSINGIVIRSDGKNTTWINGNKALGNETIGGVKVLTNAISKKSLKIPVLVNGVTVKIKPGQSWSEDTGVIADNY